MKKSYKIIAILMSVSIGLNLTACSITDSSEEDIAITETAELGEDIFENANMFMNYFKKYDSNGIYAMTSSNFQESVEKKVIVDQNKALKKQLGEIKSFSDLRLVFDSSYKTILVYTEFEKGSYDVRISFNEDGKHVEGYTLQESVIDGEKKETKNYLGEGISFESGEFNLNGTLLLPKKQDKAPVVILLQGSGASDRDETIYGLNKPLRDIAEGLTDAGIATLRYDKRTYTHGHELLQGDIENISVEEEYTEDLLAAIEYLKSRNEIDSENIYILGHSLSGYLLPYFYENIPDIKGGISLAGTISDSFEDLMKYQYEYLANYDEEISEEEQVVLDEFNKEYKLVKKLKAGETVENSLILGIGQKYWNFFNSYEGVEEFKQVSKPTLFLQGERDYQVPMNNYNTYKDELASKENFNFKSYKKLSHIFMEGSKKPSPSDYTQQLNVDLEVIKDINNWVRDN